MVLTEHRTTQLSASRVQRAAETALALVGRAIGYRTGLKRRGRSSGRR
jgi:hypothetical protein